VAGAVVYAAIWLMVWRAAAGRLAHPPQQAADAALVLGNRAYLNGKPNPCLTGRVDAALALAQAGLVPRLVHASDFRRWHLVLRFPQPGTRVFTFSFETCVEPPRPS
jgi:vancomycin permeability regulator SanA